jgi:hypothetical protein
MPTTTRKMTGPEFVDARAVEFLSRLTMTIVLVADSPIQVPSANIIEEIKGANVMFGPETTPSMARANFVVNISQHCTANYYLTHFNPLIPDHKSAIAAQKSAEYGFLEIVDLIENVPFRKNWEKMIICANCEILRNIALVLARDQPEEFAFVQFTELFPGSAWEITVVDGMVMSIRVITAE